MRPFLAVHATLLALTSALSVGCHRRTVQTAVTPRATLGEEHCWWSAFRTAMPPDSVAAHYARAFTMVGLSGAGWAQLGDTAWAQAEPTFLSRPEGVGTYAARVVAYRRGDTTFFRPFNAVEATGPANLGAMGLGFCQNVMRAAQTGGAAPRDEEPDDSLPLWRRRPLH